MLRIRTFCFALLIPLLLDLLVFFTALPARADSQTQLRQGSEDVQKGGRELEERNEEEEEEEDEFSFGGLLASSQHPIHPIDFQCLESAAPPPSFWVSRAFGWEMPLRI